MENWGGPPGARAVDLARRRLPHCRGRRTRGVACYELGLFHRALRSHAHGDYLDGMLRVLIAVNALVFLVERLGGSFRVPGYGPLLTLGRIKNIGKPY